MSQEGGQAGSDERNARLDTLLRVAPRGDIGWIYMSPAVTVSRGEAEIPSRRGSLRDCRRRRRPLRTRHTETVTTDTSDLFGAELTRERRRRHRARLREPVPLHHRHQPAVPATRGMTTGRPTRRRASLRPIPLPAQLTCRRHGSRKRPRVMRFGSVVSLRRRPPSPVAAG